MYRHKPLWWLWKRILREILSTVSKTKEWTPELHAVQPSFTVPWLGIFCYLMSNFCGPNLVKAKFFKQVFSVKLFFDVKFKSVVLRQNKYRSTAWAVHINISSCLWTYHPWTMRDVFCSIILPCPDQWVLAVQQMRPLQVQSSQPQLIWLLPRSFHQSSDSHRPPSNRDTTYNFWIQRRAILPITLLPWLNRICQFQ